MCNFEKAGSHESFSVKGEDSSCFWNLILYHQSLLSALIQGDD